MFNKNIIIFFLIGFLSDIILNILARNNLIPSLIPYFKNKSFIEAGAYAGLTVLSAMIPLMIINKLLFGKYIPNEIKDIIIFIILGFIIGYIYDIIIDKMNIFGESLKPFYQTFGSGFYGGLSIVFTIVVSYLINIYI
jgi:hypothetical protein